MKKLKPLNAGNAPSAGRERVHTRISLHWDVSTSTWISSRRIKDDDDEIITYPHIYIYRKGKRNTIRARILYACMSVRRARAHTHVCTRRGAHTREARAYLRAHARAREPVYTTICELRGPVAPVICFRQTRARRSYERKNWSTSNVIIFIGTTLFRFLSLSKKPIDVTKRS